MSMTRRRTLGALGAAASASPFLAAGAERRRDAHMRPLGIQLYMLNGPLEQDFQGTLTQLAAIGYREVEFAGFHNRTGAQLRAALDAAGLTCPSLHVPLEPMFPGMPSLQEPGEILKVMKALGAAQVVVPSFLWPERFTRTLNMPELLRDMPRLAATLSQIAQQMTVEDWKTFARRLNETGSLLAKSGVHIGYHNHNLEFGRLGDSNPLEILIRETDPALVSFELDVGWAAAAGVDPTAFLARHAGRINQLHLKDVATVSPTGTLGMKSADLGAGVIDWPRLLRAIRGARIAHLYVEQEEPFTTTPMDAAKAAFGFLQGRTELYR